MMVGVLSKEVGSEMEDAEDAEMRTCWSCRMGLHMSNYVSCRIGFCTVRVVYVVCIR